MSYNRDIIEDELSLNKEEFLEDFFEESKEHIENIEIGILNLEREMTNRKIINEIFRSFHTVKGLSGFVSQDLIEKIAHSTENLLVKIKKTRLTVNKVIIDKLLDSIDFIKRICFCPELNRDSDFLKEVDNHIKFMESEGNFKKFGQILRESKVIDEKKLNELLDKQKESDGIRLGELAVKENIISAKDAVMALREQEISIQESSYIKIPVNRIDDLINLSGELMILHSQLGADNYNNEKTKHVRMEKLIKDIQKSSMSLRMVSLKSTFQKLARIERDTSRNLNRSVRLTITGEETEIDRDISEKILEPLSHLLKNAIYHGIEDEETRLEKNKSKEGKIELNAYTKRGIVFIELKDDGRGLDIEKIYEKAQKKGILKKGKKYTEKEIIEFIFAPGFSTVENVNKVAGRGVGMDVVKERLSDFGGKIEIESQRDTGTKFTMKIPINLASVNGTIVKVGDEKYIIPTSFIQEIIKWNKDYEIKVGGKEKMVKIRDKIVTVIDDRSFFRKNFEKSEKTLMIVLGQEKEKKVLFVDEILDRRDIVVKPLGEEFVNIKFVSGASILGDGKIALILDIENMFKTN